MTEGGLLCKKRPLRVLSNIRLKVFFNAVAEFTDFALMTSGLFGLVLASKNT